MGKIGVVTSGGDAPGMNAAIRAVVRTAVPRGFEVLGIERGYAGLLNNETRPLDPRSVGGIIHLGGTVLKTARCKEFLTKEGIEKAVKILESRALNALIVIGGDGAFRGALELSRSWDSPVIGIPATIDNDVAGTDTTIGFDTAVNTALLAIDKIRDTAMSHGRVFVAEVMGKNRGFLALEVGLTAGAEIILVPEVDRGMNSVYKRLKESRKRGKSYNIVVVAEGVGNTMKIAEKIREKTGYEVRLSILGYIQRGGTPTAQSRLIADLFGSEAVKMLSKGKKNMIVALKNGRVTSESLKYACENRKPLNQDLLELAEELAI
jgi:6-phosphofructokinase 1